jgi:AcrR family transcriptional regulator
LASKSSKPSSTGAAEDAVTRGDRTRQAIKSAILRLLMRKDVADINLSEICKAAKLTTGALYFHFRGKDEAVEETVADIVRRAYAQPERLQAKTFEELVGLTLELSTGWHVTSKRLPRAVTVVINSRPAAYEAWIEARRPVVAHFERLIAEARRARDLSEDPAPYLALFILNSIEDLAMDVFQWRNPTLAQFAEDPKAWNDRQKALWTWAILAPMPEIGGNQRRASSARPARSRKAP